MLYARSYDMSRMRDDEYCPPVIASQNWSPRSLYLFKRHTHEPAGAPLLAMSVALVTRIAFTVLEVHIERRRALYSGDQAPVGEVMISITVHVDSYRAAMQCCPLCLPFNGPCSSCMRVGWFSCATWRFSCVT
jgi:hypothetical protein